MMKLKTTDHSRDAAGLTYVYPVLSRRAGGLSIGINLNPNNACNWQCIYCQVPELTRGAAPETDLDQLEQELRLFLDDVLNGNFYTRFEVAPPMQVIRDLALSGNGEPTSSPQFADVMAVIERVMYDHDLVGNTGLTLITNGSLMQRDTVQRGLRRMAQLGGEAWFKLDAATDAAIKRINQAAVSPERMLDNLELAAECCPVWVQTCLFALNGRSQSDTEWQAWLNLLRQALERGVSLRGVLLYGLARPSMQPGAAQLSALSQEQMQGYAADIEALGLTVRLSV